MSLPIFTTTNKDLSLLQTTWSALINPFIRRPQNVSNILKDVNLIIGDNTINHLLGRKMQGWVLSDINAVSSIYRNAPFNEQTLVLNSSAVVTVSIEVF